MRVARDELVRDRVRDVGELELALLLRELGLEHDLEQEVAELLTVLARVARVDRLEHLVRLLEHVRSQAPQRLLAVPRAAVGPAEPLHDPEETFDGIGGARHGRVFLAQERAC